MAKATFDRLTKKLTIEFTTADIIALEDDIAVDIGDWYQNHLNQITRQKKKPMANKMLQKARAEKIVVNGIEEEDLVIQYAQQPNYLCAKARMHKEEVERLEQEISINNSKVSEKNSELISLSDESEIDRVQSEINSLEAEAVEIGDRLAMAQNNLSSAVNETNSLLEELN